MWYPYRTMYLCKDTRHLLSVVDSLSNGRCWTCTTACCITAEKGEDMLNISRMQHWALVLHVVELDVQRQSDFDWLLYDCPHIFLLTCLQALDGLAH